MDKFVVHVDLDNVLNNKIAATLQRYNTTLGTNYTLKDICAYNLEDCIPLEDANRMKQLFLDKELCDSLDPIEKSQWGLRTLVNKGYNVYIATSTHYSNFAYKIEWIKKFYPFFDINNVIKIDDKSLLRTDVIIEDCYENLVNSYPMAERVLLDYPWNSLNKNKDYIYGINRAYNWEDVVRFVNKIYSERE